MTEPPSATQPSLGGSAVGGPARPQFAGSMRFVGRDGPLAELVAALPPGDRALTLVAGEAGIGKSRLVSEAVAIARQRGHRVLRGQSLDADAAPPFSPWTPVIRSLLPAAKGDDLRALLLDDPTATRFDLFTAVASLLATAQETAPLVVVLEDLHVADQQSIALLRFLAHERRAQRILFIGTFRPAEVRDPVVREKIAILEQVGARIDLHGLSIAELHTLIPEHGPEAAELHAITGGNPLFVEQVLRLWVTRGELHAAPGFLGVTTDSSLRSVTRSRLEQLPDASRIALSAIAVHGRPLAPQKLAQLLGKTEQIVQADLTPSIDAGVLVRSSSPGDRAELGGEIAFAHILLANAAVELSTQDHIRTLHHRCAEVLRDRRGRGAERAHHLLHSGAEHAEEALGACEVAGREAMAALAFENAVTHFRQALRVIDVFGVGDAARRTRVVIERGSAQWAAGDYVEAERSIDEAWEQAVRDGDTSALALAALGPGFRLDFTGDAALARATRCTTALSAIPAVASPLRARLLATLAAAQLMNADASVAQTTAAAALAMAERTGDDLALGYALVADIAANLDPDTLDARLHSARRVLSIARLHGDRDLASQGYFLLLAAFLESGDIRAIDAELEPRHHEADAFSELRDSRHAGWFRCSRALLEGNADLAEQLAKSSFELAQRHRDPDAQSAWIAQISVVRWMQGRTSELEPYYLHARESEPDRDVWSAVLAWLWATQGRLDDAAGALAQIRPLSEIPRDRHWFLTMSAMSEVAAIVGDEHRARALRDALIPYATRLVPIGLGVAAWGTVSRPLGLLAGVLGRHDEALSHHRESVRVCTQAGAIPWLVESWLDVAEALGASTEADAGQEAVSLAAQALAAARRLALSGLVHRAETVLDAHGAALEDTAGAPDSAKSSVRSRPTISILGRFEVIGADGSLAHWTSRKARALVQLLVAERGAAVSRERVMDVLWPGEAPATLSNRMSVAMSTVRRALDPARSHPPQSFLRADRNVLQLNIDELDIDVEDFLRSSAGAIAEREPNRDAALTRAIELYTGEAFPDEPYADWVQQLRFQAQNSFAALCRLRAESAANRGNLLLAAESYRRVLGIDPYDERAHLGLIAALESLGVEGQARLARDHHRAMMLELAS